MDSELLDTMSREQSSHSISSPKRVRFIYDLPYDRIKILCDMLDLNDNWKELGGIYMKFDPFTLNKISRAVYRKESPTEELLFTWGNQNHTILELFFLLSKMKHFQAMGILKPFVDPKYHRLVYEGKSRLDLSNESSSEETLRDAKNSNRDIDRLRTLDHLTADSLANNANKLSKKQKKELPKSADTSSSSESTSPLDSHEFDSCVRFIKYTELQKATDNWNPANKLGRGGFGVVYKGVTLDGVIAVKRLEVQEVNKVDHKTLETQRQQLIKELKFLNYYTHDNILPLYGYSIQGNIFCLVYQYMLNGSLEDRLLCRHGTEPLFWYQRIHIIRGVARGLQFLHGADKPLVHGDIKTANILLDAHYEPKIGDFGLAREGPVAQYTHVKVSRVSGTQPYLPDEFLRAKKLSTKVDIYSFGVVLFEVATGLRPYDRERSKRFLKDYIVTYDEERLLELVDTRAGHENAVLFVTFIDLGKKCVQDRPRDRPEMAEILRQLDDHVRSCSSVLPARKPSLLPGSSSYHLQRLFDGSNPRGSRSPTNQETVNLTRPNPALNIVPEVSNTDNRIVEPETNVDAAVLPIEEEKIQNIPPVPDIKLTPADHSTSQNISVDATASSFTDESMTNSVTEQSIESIQSGETVETTDENDGNESIVIPNISLLKLE